MTPTRVRGGGEDGRRRSPGRWPAAGRAALVGAIAAVAACTLVGVPPAGPAPGGEDAAGEPPPSEGVPSGREPSGEGRRPGAPSGFDEVRALWVVRTTLYEPDSVRAMVRRADEAGFNTLLVQVRGRGDAFYRSRWEPPASALADEPAGYDPLALAIREAHARGLEVHAWVNAHLVGGIGNVPDDPRHLIQARPDLLAVPRALARELYDVDPRDPRYVRALLEYARDNRESVEGIYTSPSDPAVKEHLHAVWMDLVGRYDVDGLHLDYVRYPSDDFDYSRSALQSFRTWVWPRLSPARRQELDRAHRADPLAYVEALPGPWGEFRRAQITDVVRRTYHGVRQRRPDAVVSAAVFADPVDAYRSRFQDWRGWLEEGILDVAVSMAYMPEDAAFRSLVRQAVQVEGGERVWAGIGIYRTTFRGTLSKIGIARELGAAGVSLFSYDWAVSRAASDRPRRAFLQRVGEEAFGVGR